MQRSYKDQDKGVSDHLEITRQTAFHEAGHAAAIYLEQKRKKLPPIYFCIQLHKQPFLTQICGGRQIIEPLMISREDFKAIENCQLAYEADIISYLAGPLAEAKYVSIRENGLFDVNLFKPDSLYHYGGTADLKEVNFYLASFLPSVTEREIRLNELFLEAFHFIQAAENWKRITALANHILNSAETYISFDQASNVLLQGREPGIEATI
jgi:hypothetical protein